MGVVAAALAQGKLPTLDQAIAILKTIPAYEDFRDIIEKIEKLKAALKKAGQPIRIYEEVTKPDDGKPRSCWVKSQSRGWGSVPSCLFSKEKTCESGKELN